MGGFVTTFARFTRPRAPISSPETKNGPGSPGPRSYADHDSNLRLNSNEILDAIYVAARLWGAGRPLIIRAYKIPELHPSIRRKVSTPTQKG